MPSKIVGTNLVYFPVPKIACTSIKLAILAHNDPAMFKLFEKGPRKEKPRHVHDVLPTIDFRIWNYFDVAIGTSWFTVVRDPIQRALSGYRNRILHFNDLKKSAPGVIACAGLSETPDINTFALNLAAYSKTNRSTRHHFAPLTQFLGTKPSRFDRVFRLSELDLLQDFVASHGVSLKIPHEQTGGPKVSLDELSEEGRAALSEFYKDDYTYWGEYF